ncbi:MAG TPA: nuclear transport factor 2 family protein [Fulvivirga sp.]|nr:nuclear transport factor 2 family protein [Fulvivirga sp.]
MSQENKDLIVSFYTAFQNKDAESMVNCYHKDIEFQDPAFGTLKGEHACNMWRMLMEKSDTSLSIKFSKVQADETKGSAYWEAVYKFSKTGRPVNNKIKALFKFKEGKIISHIDSFNIWKWSAMALGPMGMLLGFTPIMKNKIRKQALNALVKFESDK